MKITGIDIGEYRQFKNIKFDFTYPEGHSKAGQPLEKVCFIGQSGTGKTTLLNVIWEFFKVVDDALQVKISKAPTHLNFNGSLLLGPYVDIHLLVGGDKILFYNEGDLIERDKPESIRVANMIDWLKPIIDDVLPVEKLCLFIEDNVVGVSSRYLQKQENSEDELFDNSLTNNKKEKRKKDYDLVKRSKSVSVSYELAQYFWQFVLSDIHEFDEELKQIAIEMLRLNSLTPAKLQSRINSWQLEHTNPRLELAQKCLNPILEKLYLELDVDEVREPVAIKTKSGVSVPNQDLSTGTKQLLATAIAVYKSEIDGGVILFDEPERSLFPDVQRELVKYYTGLAPDAQFFFATHSPIIAAAFEPCERFILYFDENGEVKFHNGIAPEGDDPNDILRQDFGMEYLMLQKGLEEYERYRQLAMQIRVETDEEKKNQLIVERLELGNRYNFAGQYAKN